MTGLFDKKSLLRNSSRSTIISSSMLIFAGYHKLVMIESILDFDIEHPIYRFFDWINEIINIVGAHSWGRQAIYQFDKNLSKRHSNLVIQSRFVYVCILVCGILVCGCAYTGINCVRSRCENWSYWIDQSQDGHNKLLTHYDN